MNSSAENSTGNLMDTFQLSTFGMTLGSINVIIALPPNVYVFWLIVTRSEGTMASELFTLNLTVSEIFLCLTPIWLMIYLHLNLVFCLKAYLFSLGLLFTARPLFQSCICVERYLAVVHPLLFLRCKSLRNRVTCCGVAWMMVLGSCMYSLYNGVKPLYHYGYFVQDLILLSVMLFCCLSVLCVLKKPGPGDGERREGNDMKRRAFKIIVLTILAMLLYYLLFLVVIPLQCCLTFMKFHLAYVIASCLAFTSGFVQPFLFLHRAGKLPCIKAF